MRWAMSREREGRTELRVSPTGRIQRDTWSIHDEIIQFILCTPEGHLRLLRIMNSKTTKPLRVNTLFYVLEYSEPSGEYLKKNFVNAPSIRVCIRPEGRTFHVKSGVVTNTLGVVMNRGEVGKK